MSTGARRKKKAENSMDFKNQKTIQSYYFKKDELPSTPSGAKRKRDNDEFNFELGTPGTPNKQVRGDNNN